MNATEEFEVLPEDAVSAAGAARTGPPARGATR